LFGEPFPTLRQTTRLGSPRSAPPTELSQSVLARFAEVGTNRGVFVTVLQAMDTEQIVDMIVKDTQ
jgi:hypothetical protein